MKEQERYFFEPRSLTGRKKEQDITEQKQWKQTRQDIKIRRPVFETKVLRTRRNVCHFLLITSDCTGTEYCKPCTFAKRSLYF